MRPARLAAPAGIDVSIDLRPSLKALENPLRDSVRQLRQGYQSVHQYLDEALAESDARAAALADCRRQLAEARRSLSESERQSAERSKAEADAIARAAQLKKLVEQRQGELATASEKLLHAQNESAQLQQRLELQSEQQRQLREQIERLQAEHQAASGELAQMRSQVAPWVQAVAEAAQLRAELAAAQGESARLREQLASAAPDAGASEKLQSLENERRQLELELDAVRHRTAELDAALEDQKRLMASERERWNEELRHLRKAVERQAELLVHGASAAAPQTPTATPTRAADSRAEDAVLDSVLEQFEMLQRTKIRKLAGASP